MNKKRERETECNGSSYDASKVPGDGPGGNNVDKRRSFRQKQHVSYQEDDDDEFTSQKRSKLMKTSNDIEDQKEHVSGFGDTSDVSMPDGNHSESDSEPELVDCPDQDFINFDKVKEEHCFAVDQIWACYDSIDGMPRFYAHINKIYSNFKLRFTWLEPDPDDDLEIKWAENGLPVACGAFVHGETEETRDRLMFSHQIIYNKKTGSKFSCVISPHKGEIWALYKDWDINWRFDSKSQKKFKYDIVEILSVNDDCVYVGFLLKVKGFVSVFKRIIRARDADHTIASNERFRFSHRVPSAKLTGTERAGVPLGSFELDMASLPGDFEDYCYYHEEKVKHMNGPEVDSVKVNYGQLQASHDFRSDKLIWKFQVGQIWAFWEHGNGTRQRYAVIKKIESQSFKLHVSLLKLCNEPHIGYNTCGLFKVSPGKPKLLAADLFSHIVKAEARGNKMFNIYPREKQIWALCKKHDAGECEIVEVVETDEVSIKATFLKRVSGSKSVFRGPGIQCLKGKIVVPRVELNRFCHQIPAFYVTDGCLRGCWELDPAALTGLHLVEASQTNSDSK
ncbi:uncharacterized protein LOC143586974 [Bidens hawaiensis]|uniref:uncharacterized protein LOC143586974 n=1 Tax=Bidens hawaiensis TaxID=980011 RepID=UPI0040498182